MKNKGLKVTLVIGIIILLSIISLIGFYQRGIYQYEDVLPEYILGDGLTGYRTIVLKPKEVEEKTENSEEKKEEEAAGETQEEVSQGTTQGEESTGNTKEMLTEENYRKAKDLIRSRLDNVSAESYYTIRLEKETGKIFIKVLDSNQTDSIGNTITQKGLFEVVDNTTKEVLLSNANIKKSTVQYTAGQAGGTVAFLNIEFDKAGKEKLKEISKTYVESKDEEGNDTSKKVAIRLDGNDLVTTTFERENTTGSLQLTIGTETTSNSELQKYLMQASNLAVVVKKDVLPLDYEVDENVYNTLPQNKKNSKIAPIAAAVLTLMLVFYLIIRYHKNGFLAILSMVGILATLLIVTRYTNVILTVESIGAIFVTMILAFVCHSVILKDYKKELSEHNAKKNFWNSMTAIIKGLVPMFILSIVFCFMRWLPIYSFGMTLFWGILTILVWIAVAMKTMLFGTRK